MDFIQSSRHAEWQRDHLAAPHREAAPIALSAQIGSFVWDVAANRCEADGAMLALLGLGPADAGDVAGAVVRTIHPADRERFLAALREALSPGAGGSLRVDIRALLPDGGERLLSVCGHACGVEDGLRARIAGAMVDTGESGRREANLRFRAEIAYDLSTISEPTEIMEVVGGKIAAFLGVNSVNFVEVTDAADELAILYCWHERAMPNLRRVYRSSDYVTEEFLRANRAGDVVIVTDASQDPRVDAVRYAALGIGALVSVPFLRDGKWLYQFSVTAPRGRLWRQDEIELIDELAARIFPRVERARHEANLRDAVRRYEQQVRIFEGVASTTPDFVYLFDRDGRFLYANRRLLEVWGMRLEDVIGKTCRELGYEQWHHDMHMREIAQVIRTKAPIKGEVPFKAPLTGIFGVYEYIFTPVLGPDGEVETIAGTTRDVTDRKLAEEAVRKSQEPLRRLVESNIIGVVTAGLDGVKTANDMFLGIIGATREELDAGRVDWAKATPPEQVDRDLRAIEEMRTKGWCTPFEKEYVHASGARVPILIGGVVLQNNPLEWICFVLDLRERKALEQRLQEKQKLESIGLLAGGIAHDFNNLLVGVLGNASLAADLLPAGSPAHSLISDVVSASERAAHLTRELLAYSGKGRFVLEPVDLSATARDVTSLVRSSIPSRVTLRLDLAPGLPPVEADPAQIQQLLMNLVINGAEAIGENPGLLTVCTAVEEVGSGSRDPRLANLEAGSYVSIRVTDTGCGMDGATQAKIFDPFFTTKFTGRGLGLAAVSGIVRGHRGAIRVTSAPGQGSTFDVLLPVGQGLPRPVGPRAPDRTDLRGAGVVLVVDDEEIVRRTASAALKRQGYEVLLAASGPAAIEILSQRPRDISVVLLDLSMPGMDGQETLRRLKPISPGIRVLISSGYNEAECLRQFGNEQISGFVQKPYTSTTLAEKVKSALAGSRGGLLPGPPVT